MRVWPTQDPMLQCYKVFTMHNASLGQKGNNLQSSRGIVEPIVRGLYVQILGSIPNGAGSMVGLFVFLVPYPIIPKTSNCVIKS